MRVLRMTEGQHATLMRHLHRDDGFEAVAFALCGRASSFGRQTLCVREVVPVPIEECERGRYAVRWPTKRIYDRLDEIRTLGFSVLKLHSHPAGAAFFSETDDASDRELLSAVARRCGGEHGSAIVLPDGAMLARSVDASGTFYAIDRIALVGDDVSFLEENLPLAANDRDTAGFDLRHRQLFGERTSDLLGSLAVAVVGASGTGSPVVEMLMRLGVGCLVLIDDDRIETKNLNRIYGSTAVDAREGRTKVEALARHIKATGLGTKVIPIVAKVNDVEAIEAIAGCDMVFGCVDSVLGRDTLAQLSAMLTLPYIDMGVRIDADGKGGVKSVSSAVHYLKPEGASLKSRGVYNDEDLYAESLRESDPQFYADQVQRGYIRGVRVDSPAVISINTQTAALAVNEALARLHPFRTQPNSMFATQRILFSHGRVVNFPEGEPDQVRTALVGLGFSGRARSMLATAA